VKYSTHIVSGAVAPKPRLLVVDDDAANLSTFRRVFRQEYDVVIAGSGAEALQVLDSQTVDVALVDHSMPGMTGLELLHWVQYLHPNVKRVMLTGYADLPELSAAIDEGLVMRIVPKPWDRSEIAQVVGQVMQLSATSGVSER
jgi:CheY-like chemotaxis protein